MKYERELLETDLDMFVPKFALSKMFPLFLQVLSLQNQFSLFQSNPFSHSFCNDSILIMNLYVVFRELYNMMYYHVTLHGNLITSADLPLADETLLSTQISSRLQDVTLAPAAILVTARLRPLLLSRPLNEERQDMFKVAVSEAWREAQGHSGATTVTAVYKGQERYATEEWSV